MPGVVGREVEEGVGTL
jgi:hypothetical protein